VFHPFVLSASTTPAACGIDRMRLGSWCLEAALGARGFAGRAVLPSSAFLAYGMRMPT